jgi:predicted peptidase
MYASPSIGTWVTAAHAPDMFAAMVPMCGGGPMMLAKPLRDMPT